MAGATKNYNSLRLICSKVEIPPDELTGELHGGGAVIKERRKKARLSGPLAKNIEALRLLRCRSNFGRAVRAKSYIDFYFILWYDFQ